MLKTIFALVVLFFIPACTQVSDGVSSPPQAVAVSGGKNPFVLHPCFDELLCITLTSDCACTVERDGAGLSSSLGLFELSGLELARCDIYHVVIIPGEYFRKHVPAQPLPLVRECDPWCSQPPPGPIFDSYPPREVQIQSAAKRLGFSIPPLEVAPLLRQALSDVDMKAYGMSSAWIMHENLLIPGLNPRRLVLRERNGVNVLADMPWAYEEGHGEDIGHVYLVP